MEISTIEGKLRDLVHSSDTENFIYEFLLLYGTAKATITKAKQDIEAKKSKQANLSGIGDEENSAFVLKQKVYFKVVDVNTNVLESIESILKEPKLYKKAKPRFIIVTNFDDFYALDTKAIKDGYLRTKFKDLAVNYEYFYPLAGRERYKAHTESIADVKAAEKMAKLYDEIVKENVDLAKEKTHELNVFLTRLLFCLFAEDTGIFEGENLFTKSLYNNTNEDASDLQGFFESLFKALDTKDKSKFEQSYLKKFPYVNGRLFSAKCYVPSFSVKAREIILECGDSLDWSEINPDIFGSMFQAVSNKEVRASLGQHYTSVPNIMKVISPLFLDELEAEYEKAKDSDKKLSALLNRISDIKIFDPACGSGNFLIIAFKQIRLLEIKIIKRIREIENGFAYNYSHILLSSFYGIEIDDFACEIARLSLYLAQHQMNCKFEDELGILPPTLPLKESGNIVCGNATRLDWDKVCPREKTLNNLAEIVEQAEIINSDLKLDIPVEYNEIYVLGNPPYLGARLQEKNHKLDMAYVFENIIKGFNNLDYISCWFKKGVNYIEKSKIKIAFVTTNSICQGVQVSLLWKKILDKEIDIFFFL